MVGTDVGGAGVDVGPCAELLHPTLMIMKMLAKSTGELISLIRIFILLDELGARYISVYVLKK